MSRKVIDGAAYDSVELASAEEIERLCETFGALEAHSSHPLARPKPEGRKSSLTGLGVRGLIEGAVRTV